MAHVAFAFSAVCLDKQELAGEAGFFQSPLLLQKTTIAAWPNTVDQMSSQTERTQKVAVYPAVDQSPNVSKMEEDVLAYWQEHNIFRETVERRSRRIDGKNNEYVFYDGPPFANGLPHYGHLATGFVKDLIPRYRTMRGQRVERRFGWDCHGLPAELTSEKELGISGRQEILEYGVEEFNAHCRKSVLRFTQEWEFYVTRQGRWVDFENSYKTMDLTFMETVLWVFKELYKQGLVYRGYRVVPYSWAVQTPLSNFETRLDNSYRERQDPALTVKFVLDAEAGESAPMTLLAWTTTPWTLPSNLALAVNKDLTYAIMEKNGERIVLAEAALGTYAKELTEFKRVGSVAGSELVGRRYTPIFSHFLGTANAFQVLAGDFVTTEQGTGIVHIAPGFGEDDLELGQANGIAMVIPVDEQGNFTAEVPEYHGQNVFDANKEIIRDLKTRDVVFRHETYVHSYPHCWRTDTPLIYKAIDAWYVKVSAFRDRMVANNEQIDWVPEHVRDGIFGTWLKNARDWNISRNRFWGCPIPIWESDDPNYPRIDVYGSLDEIERDFGRRPDDLHRPFIDEFVRPNPDDPTGKSMMRRTSEVLDVWFDSGSMPFAQLHYPFENKQRFEENFPADFIVEYIAQTRGWFYTLIVLSTALMDVAPFKTCVCHGVVLDENKQKLSKRLKNYPDPIDVLNDYGADALRVYMLSSPLLVGGDLAIDIDGRGIREALRATILPLWNSYYFFTLYANTDGYKAKLSTASEDIHDRYILAKTREFVEGIEAALEQVQIPDAYALVPGFIDVLNNWYIRRNRVRFWSSGVDLDKQAAFNTLYTVLVTASTALAPMMPFLVETIVRNLTGDRSVHLRDWPEVSSFPVEDELKQEMGLVREICSAGMMIRSRNQMRVRQPLRQLTIAHPASETIERYRDTIADELNVKKVVFELSTEGVGSAILRVDPKIGRRIGGQVQKVLKAAKVGEWHREDDGKINIAGVKLEKDDYTFSISSPESHDAALIDNGVGAVMFDLSLDQTLRDEAVARDFMRFVQEARKKAELDVSDRIAVQAEVPNQLVNALLAHKEQILKETLCDQFEMVPSRTLESAEVFKINDQTLRISLSVV